MSFPTRSNTIRRFSRTRTQSWSTTISGDFIMEPVSRSSTSSSKTRVRNYDTGFPEPFCGTGNTTLRHPDADTSPNACISSHEVDLSKAFGRRRTFLGKHKRAVNYGKIKNLCDSSSSLVDMSIPESPMSRPSTDSSESISRSSSSHSDTPFPTMATAQDSNSLAPSNHRSGMLRKLRLHD